MGFSKFWRLAAVASAVLLAGCGLTQLNADYVPTSTLSAHGAVQIGSFAYLPATSGKLKPNQLRNAAFAQVLLNQNVDDYVRQSLLKELRFVGIKIGDRGAVVGGEVEDFFDDDSGGNVLTLTVRYVVKDATGTVLYDAEKSSHQPMSYGTGNPMDRALKANFEQVIADAAFIKAIN